MWPYFNTAQALTEVDLAENKLMIALSQPLLDDDRSVNVKDEESHLTASMRRKNPATLGQVKAQLADIRKQTINLKETHFRQSQQRQREQLIMRCGMNDCVDIPI